MRALQTHARERTTSRTKETTKPRRGRSCLSARLVYAKERARGDGACGGACVGCGFIIGGGGGGTQKRHREDDDDDDAGGDDGRVRCEGEVYDEAGFGRHGDEGWDVGSGATRGV